MGRGLLTGVVEGAVVLEEDHLSVEVHDLLPRFHQLHLRLRSSYLVLQLLQRRTTTPPLATDQTQRKPTTPKVTTNE